LRHLLPLLHLLLHLLLKPLPALLLLLPLLQLKLLLLPQLQLLQLLLLQRSNTGYTQQKSRRKSAFLFP